MKKRYLAASLLLLSGLLTSCELKEYYVHPSKDYSDFEVTNYRNITHSDSRNEYALDITNTGQDWMIVNYLTLTDVTNDKSYLYLSPYNSPFNAEVIAPKKTASFYTVDYSKENFSLEGYTLSGRSYDELYFRRKLSKDKTTIELYNVNEYGCEYYVAFSGGKKHYTVLVDITYGGKEYTISTSSKGSNGNYYFFCRDRLTDDNCTVGGMRVYESIMEPELQRQYFRFYASIVILFGIIPVSGVITGVTISIVLRKRKYRQNLNKQEK